MPTHAHALQATALKWCQDENQKLRQELYDLKHEIKEDQYESNESGVKEQKLYGQVFSLTKEKEVLEEQLKQQNDWFQEIIRLVGADSSESAVNAVSDYVREHQ